MEFRAIGPADAPAVAAIEAQLHDPKLINGEERLRDFLEKADASGNSCCFGLFHKGEMGGYLLCGDLVSSYFKQLKGDRVIYIHDISVLPKYRRLSFRLLSTWWEAARQRFPGTAVEMHIIEEGKQLWLGHANMLTRNGLEFQLCEHDGKHIKGQRRYRMRFNQLSRYNSCNFDLEDHQSKLQILAEHDGLQLRLLDDPSAWPHYRPLLQALFEAETDKCPTLDYALQRSRWLHHGYGQALHQLMVYRGNALVSVVPLYKHQQRYPFMAARESLRYIVPVMHTSTSPVLGDKSEAVMALLSAHLPERSANPEPNATTAPLQASPDYTMDIFEPGPTLDAALLDLGLLHTVDRNDQPSLQLLHDHLQQASFDADYCHHYHAQLMVLRCQQQAFAAAYMLFDQEQAWVAISGRNIGNGYGNSQRLIAHLAADQLSGKALHFITRQ